jgi:hypothetical protein
VLYLPQHKVNQLSLKKCNIIAGLLTIVSLLILLVLPLFVYAAIMGIGWDDKTPLPDWLLWFVILGGVIGAGLCAPIHHFIICKVGGYPRDAANISW